MTTDRYVTISGKEATSLGSILNSISWNSISPCKFLQSSLSEWFIRQHIPREANIGVELEVIQYLNDLLQIGRNPALQEPYEGVKKWKTQLAPKHLKIYGRFMAHVVEEIDDFASTTIDRQPLIYADRFFTVAKLFTELEHDFDDIPRRVARCGLLEEELHTLEETLEDDEPEYLSWCISLLRDVFDYNYAEDLNRSHLPIIKEGIKLICQRGSSCNREEYQELHRNLMQTGLSLLPTSDKACEKYKYEENDNERQSLLFP